MADFGTVRSAHDALRTLAQLGRSMIGAELKTGQRVQVRRERLGSAYGGWWLRSDWLTHASVVYSAGVGTDISFDVAVIERFGCSVFGFDPTPVSVKWARATELPSGFHFIPLGLADYDGIASFALRSNPKWTSYEMNISTVGAFDIAQLQVRRVTSLMRELGHKRVDVLKLDIEGAELAVILDVIAAGLEIPQLLVEFHHRRGDRQSLSANQAVVDAVLNAGYRTFACSPGGRELSFTR